MKREEVDLGPPVVRWLNDDGWEVYQEVHGIRGNAVADLVAVTGKLVAIVELKLSLTFELLAQARRWRGLAHQVWVAVPHAKRSDGRSEAHRVFDEAGIGVLTVHWPSSAHAFPSAVVRPAFNRRAEAQEVRRILRPEQKTFAAAGSAHGGHWTEFKGTCERLREYLGTHPGASIRDAVGSIKHHYASDAGARARLVHLIERRIIKGIRLERDGRERRLYAE